MATLDSHLADGETVIHRAHLGKGYFVADIVIGALLLPFLVGILVWLFAYLRYSRTEMLVTNRRLIGKTGFAARYTVDLPLAQVDSLQVGQSRMGMLFQYGTVTVYSAGKARAPMEGLAHPEQLQHAYLEAAAKAAVKTAVQAT
jgi:uncharacterized membrane protein YdbT with pleckstrin-like domain